LSRLNHPKIIKFYSSFQDKTHLYLVFDHAANGSLAKYMKLNSKLLNTNLTRNFLSNADLVLCRRDRADSASFEGKEDCPQRPEACEHLVR
jgi:hypothetical protein